MHIIRILSLLVLCAFFSCKDVESPIFKSIDKVKVETMSLELVELSSTANFYNPNGVRIQVLDGNIEVIANGVNLGLVEFTKPSDIPAKGDFKLNMMIRFPPSEVFNKKGGLIGGLIASALDKSVELEYIGYINVDIVGVTFRVPIKEYEELELKF